MELRYLFEEIDEPDRQLFFTQNRATSELVQEKLSNCQINFKIVFGNNCVAFKQIKLS
jgi:hypothetical protein